MLQNHTLPRRDDAADVVLADPTMLMSTSAPDGGSGSGSSSGRYAPQAGGDGVRGAQAGSRSVGAQGGAYEGSGGGGSRGQAGQGPQGDAQAAAAAALDEIIKAESQGANRTKRSRSRRREQQQQQQ